MSPGTKKLKLEELNRVDISTFKRQKKNPIVLILDNIRSGMNVGSIFRSADGLGIEQVCLIGITPTPPHTEITKTAIGATLSVKWKYYENIQDCIAELKEEQFTIIGLEQTNNSISLEKINWPMRVGLILGNEVSGISETALPLCEYFVEIPQFGTKHSLNVSVAAGIVLWEIVKALKY